MLEVSLGRLYRAIATWRPPSRRVAITCLGCISSPFRDAASLALLPEDVVHDFLRDLDRVVVQRLAQLRDEREADYASIGLEWDQVADRETQRNSPPSSSAPMLRRGRSWRGTMRRSTECACSTWSRGYTTGSRAPRSR